MGTIFLGSEALARGEVTWGQLRSRYRAIYPDVYTPRIAEPSLYANAVGAWLWSGRRAPITGRAASSIHGSLWVDERAPIELLWRNNRPPHGIITRNDHFTDDDVVEVNDMAVATPQRTAYDLGRYLPRLAAVTHLDALSRATGLAADHVAPLIDRYRGARGIRRLRHAIDLMDGGAQSPKETWLRLLLIDAGYPRPRTQIPVVDDFGYEFACLDMGWEDVMIAVEYDGDQHRTDRIRYAWDVKRLRRIHEQGWLHVKVISEDRPDDVLQRVAQAWAARRGSSYGD
jgi:very-short-patch-repair endonuclease